MSPSVFFSSSSSSLFWYKNTFENLSFHRQIKIHSNVACMGSDGRSHERGFSNWFSTYVHKCCSQYCVHNLWHSVKQYPVRQIQMCTKEMIQFTQHKYHLYLFGIVVRPPETQFSKPFYLHKEELHLAGLTVLFVFAFQLFWDWVLRFPYGSWKSGYFGIKSDFLSLKIGFFCASNLIFLCIKSDI